MLHGVDGEQGAPLDGAVQSPAEGGVDIVLGQERGQRLDERTLRAQRLDVDQARVAALAQNGGGRIERDDKLGRVAHAGEDVGQHGRGQRDGPRPGGEASEGSSIASHRRMRPGTTGRRRGSRWAPFRGRQLARQLARQPARRAVRR